MIGGVSFAKCGVGSSSAEEQVMMATVVKMTLIAVVELARGMAYGRGKGEDR